MVEVNLWSGLRKLADGQTVVSLEARTLREMLAALVAVHPGLEPVIKAGISVTVNGEIANDLSTAIADPDEIYLIQRIKGG